MTLGEWTRGDNDFLSVLRLEGRAGKRMSTSWCVSLPGDPAWWQAFTGVVQAVLAFAVFYVTRRYVELTGHLVTMQRDIVNLQKQAERRELYDRRLRIYNAVMSFLAKFAQDVKIDLQSIIQLHPDTRDADFLFGPEIPDLIKKIAQEAHRHRALRPDQAIATGDMERLHQIEEIENWLMVSAFEEAKAKFGVYLRLSEPAEVD